MTIKHIWTLLLMCNSKILFTVVILYNVYCSDLQCSIQIFRHVYMKVAGSTTLSLHCVSCFDEYMHIMCTHCNEFQFHSIKNSNKKNRGTFTHLAMHFNDFVLFTQVSIYLVFVSRCFSVAAPFKVAT